MRVRVDAETRAATRLSTKPRFRGSYLLRRAAGDEVEFITIIFWESLDAVRALTGFGGRSAGRLNPRRVPDRLRPCAGRLGSDRRL